MHMHMHLVISQQMINDTNLINPIKMKGIYIMYRIICNFFFVKITLLFLFSMPFKKEIISPLSSQPKNEAKIIETIWKNVQRHWIKNNYLIWKKYILYRRKNLYFSFFIELKVSLH